LALRLWKIYIRHCHDVEVVLEDIECDERNDLSIGEAGTLKFRARAIALLSDEGPGEPQGSVELRIIRATFAASQNVIVG